MRLKSLLAALCALPLLAAPSRAALVLELTDSGSPSPFANGSGTGFGGALGSGTFSFDAIGTDVVIAFSPGASIAANDIVTLFLDTRAGGFTDLDMNDTADGGRRAISNLTRDSNDLFPIQPDFAIAFGTFGAALFELNAGLAPGHLNFLQSSISTSLTIPLASLGAPVSIDFFAAFVSDTNFISNEALPGPALSGVLGFGDGSDVTHPNYNRFNVVPEPGSIAFIVLSGGFLILRHRRRW